MPIARWEVDQETGQVRWDRFVDSARAKQELITEVPTWMRLTHPHIAQALDANDDESTDYLPAICMEYCGMGSLAGRIYNGIGLTLADGLVVAI